MMGDTCGWPQFSLDKYTLDFVLNVDFLILIRVLAYCFMRVY